MKHVITKPALLSSKKEIQKQNNQSLFRKHNFCVATADGSFKAFSYEAQYSGSNVDITISSASTGQVVKTLSPTIDRIAKKAIFNRVGSMNTSEYVVVYEDFCDALFQFICDHISDSEDFSELDY